MNTPFRRGADPHQDRQRPLPCVEAAHAASEIDDDDVGEDPLAFVRGLLFSLKFLVVGGLLFWLWARWASA